MSAPIAAALTLSALHLAWGRRRPGANLLHHSDRGVQYCASVYRQMLESEGIAVSMSRRANCYDNAPMESANGTLKVERVHDQHYATRQQAIDDLTAYFGYYNTERRHSAPGYVSPARFEQHWHQQQTAASRSAPSYPPSGALRSSQATQAPARG